MRHLFRVNVSCTVIASALLATSANAAATPRFDTPQQSLGSALDLFAQQAGQRLISEPTATASRQSQSIRNRIKDGDSRRASVVNTDLSVTRNDNGLILSQLAPTAQSAMRQAVTPSEESPVKRAEVQGGSPDTDIIVAALKRGETVLKTAVMVSALSSARIGLLGVTNIADVARLTPQLVGGDSPNLLQRSKVSWGEAS